MGKLPHRINCDANSTTHVGDDASRMASLLSGVRMPVLLLSLLATCVDVTALAADSRPRVELRFDTNVAVVDDPALLDAIAADVADTTGPICVLGATDDVGDDDDNLALGGARAVGVRRTG